MKITEELIPLIEKALGFELYEWQKKYLMDKAHIFPRGRAVGKTTVHIVKFLLTNEELIEMNDVTRFIDHHGTSYKYFFISQVKYINDKLTDAGIPTQLVLKQKSKQSISITIDADTNKMQLKLRAIAKHAEALANELDAIDNAIECPKCGSGEVCEMYGNEKLYHASCNDCGHVIIDDLPTRFEGSD